MGTCTPHEACVAKESVFKTGVCANWSDPLFVGCDSCQNQSAVMDAAEIEADARDFLRAALANSVLGQLKDTTYE